MCEQSTVNPNYVPYRCTKCAYRLCFYILFVHSVMHTSMYIACVCRDHVFESVRAEDTKDL